MSEITLAQQLACAKREYRMRCSVYPQRIQAGRMHPADAQRELMTMQAIIETLARLRQAEIGAQQADLFAGRAE